MKDYSHFPLMGAIMTASQFMTAFGTNPVINQVLERTIDNNILMFPECACFLKESSASDELYAPFLPVRCTLNTGAPVFHYEPDMLNGEVSAAIYIRKDLSNDSQDVGFILNSLVSSTNPPTIADLYQSGEISFNSFDNLPTNESILNLFDEYILDFTVGGGIGTTNITVSVAPYDAFEYALLTPSQAGSTTYVWIASGTNPQSVTQHDTGVPGNTVVFSDAMSAVESYQDFVDNGFSISLYGVHAARTIENVRAILEGASPEIIEMIEDLQDEVDQLTSQVTSLDDAMVNIWNEAQEKYHEFDERITRLENQTPNSGNFVSV